MDRPALGRRAATRTAMSNSRRNHGKKFLWIAALLLLTGCQTPGPVIHANLDAMKGQPVKNAFAKLGYPQHEDKIAGEKLYIWSNAYTALFPSTSTTSGSGTAGGKLFNYSQTTYGDDEAVHLQCTLRIFVDKNENITHWDGQGNNGACARYAKALDPSYRF